MIAFHFIVSSLLIISTFLHSSLVYGHIFELSDKTFKSLTAVGVHFVEFYSPTCKHCRKFKPVYDEIDLNTRDIQEKGEITLSKIDCIKYADLCYDVWKIPGFPTLYLIEDGEKKAAYEKDRDLQPIIDFIKGYSKVTDKQKKVGLTLPWGEESATKHVKALLKPYDEGVRKEDGMLGKVIKLDGKNFFPMTENGVWFVKFYAPWCGHCKSIAPIWESLADLMKGKMNIAEVNGDIDRSLMSRFELRGFPSLLLFENGEMKEHYEGPRTLLDMGSFCNKAVGQEAVFEMIDSEGDMEDTRKENDVVFLYMIDDFQKKVEAEDVLNSVAHRLRDNAKFLASNDPLLGKTYKFNTLTCFKRDDSAAGKVLTFEGDLSDKSAVETWIGAQVRVPMVEISGKNAAKILDASNTYVILMIYFSASSWRESPDRKAFWKLSSDLENKNLIPGSKVVFAALNAKLYPNYVKEVFGYDPAKISDGTKLVIINTEKKYFHNEDIKGKALEASNQEQITGALNDAVSHNIPMKSMKGSFRTLSLEALRRGGKAPFVAILLLIISVLSFGYVLLSLLRYLLGENSQNEKGSYSKIE